MKTFNGYRLSESAARAAQGLPTLRPAAPMEVGGNAVALSRVAPSAPSPLAMDAQSIFAPYKFPEGVYPAGAGMAMDSCAALPPAVGQWAASALFHEGQGFFGFPYLAELVQRVEYRNACHIWAEHAVRKWIKFKNVDDEKSDELEKAFRAIKVRKTFYDYAMQDNIFGRGQIFMDFGDATDPNELATPLTLEPSKINKDRPIKALKVVEPFWCAPGPYGASNPLRQDFYVPAQWYAYGMTVDASRLLTMTSRPVPDMLKPAYAFGGQSLTQVMKAYVDNWLRSRQSSSDLLDMHSQPVLKTDMSSVLSGGGGDDFFKRLDLFQNTRNNRSVLGLDMEQEEFSFVTTPLSGVADLVKLSNEQVAASARIPLSIYLQITPTGLNATSDGETRNFYADVHAFQEAHFRPGLEVILKIVQLSLWGAVDPNIDFEFVPLWEMSDKDKADIRKVDADTDVAYCQAGIIDVEEARERLRLDETGLYAGVDLSGPAPEPPEEPTDGEDGSDDGGDKPAMDADWKEEDHPRAPDGKFGSGGGSGGPNKPAAPAAKEGGEPTPAAKGSGQTAPYVTSAKKPAHPLVTKELGEKGVDRVRELIARKDSTAAEIFAALEPLDELNKRSVVTMREEDYDTPEKVADFLTSRGYVDLQGNKTNAAGAVGSLIAKAESYAEENGGVGVRRERKARLILGPPAAGKSTSAERIASTQGYAIVDSDDAKKVVPEFDDGLNANGVHAESSELQKEVLRKMLGRGDNVILPLVGGSPGSIEKRIKGLQAAGYDVTVDVLDVHPDEAARRMAGRTLSKGRHIATGYAASIGSSPLQTYETLKTRYPDLAFGKINGNGSAKEEVYEEAINHPSARAGTRLFT